jgi:hypothetical protein
VARQCDRLDIKTTLEGFGSASAERSQVAERYLEVGYAERLPVSIPKARSCFYDPASFADPISSSTLRPPCAHRRQVQRLSDYSKPYLPARTWTAVNVSARGRFLAGLVLFTGRAGSNPASDTSDQERSFPPTSGES